MKTTHRSLLALVGIAASLQIASGQTLVNDTTFTANNSTAAGGYIYATALGNPILTGGSTLAMTTDPGNGSTINGDYSFINRRFASQAMDVGDRLTLSFTVLNINTDFDDFRSFAFAFVGSSSPDMPTTNTSTISSADDTYYSLGGIATQGNNGQSGYNGLRANWTGGNGLNNPLAFGGTNGGGNSPNGASGINNDDVVQFSIERINNNVDGFAQYTVMTIVNPNGLTPDTSRGSTTIGGRSTTEFLSWDGLAIGATGSMANDAAFNLTLDNIIVQYTAVPEPSSVLLILGGVGLLVVRGIRRRQA